MANALDPYREALVVETMTVWPDDLPARRWAIRPVGQSRSVFTPPRPPLPNWTMSASTRASFGKSLSP